MSDLIARQRAVIPNWVGVYYNEPIEIVSGKGCRVTDSQGHTYLDFFAGILTNMLGYDVAEVREAVERQLATGIYHTSTLYLIRSQVELAEKIAKLSGIPNAKVFFTNSGSEANETALTAALTARKANQVLAMRNSYHGRTFGTVAITGNAVWKATSNDPFGTHYLHGTDKSLPQFRNLSDAEYIDACVADLKGLLQAAINPQDVGALIAEPIQGVGGFITPPKEYFKIVTDIVRKYGGIFIADEVQTAWGRTGGKWFGIEHWDVQPDIITSAKGLGNGLPIGVTIARPEIADAMKGVTISTFGGNPVSTTAAKAVLDYIEEENLLRNTEETGAYLRGKLIDLQDKHTLIGDVRGMGLLLALELVEDRKTKAPATAATLQMIEATRENRIMVGRGGLYGNVLRLSPPMNIDRADVDEFILRLDASFTQVARGASALARA
jgi:4-aminobutyrate aminotransferase